MRSVPFVLVAIVAGCSAPNLIPPDASSALRNATTFELFSLDPTPREEESDGETFHNWMILGSAEITDAATRTVLLDALDAGVAENNGIVAACFDPRHGIRVKYDGKQYDFIICFECYHAEWYADDTLKKGFLLTGSPQTTFDRVLREASIKLPAPAE